MEENSLTQETISVSSAPHIRAEDDTQRIMFVVVIALIPALLGSVYFFGMRALWLTLIAVITAVSTELIIQRLLARSGGDGCGTSWYKTDDPERAFFLRTLYCRRPPLGYPLGSELT